ncbi:hypothetical protein CAPTEDRAFT_200821 [Capitella teleta]|uniref:F-box domain-containing protein n=1 Tax=Capitella teleta TaxID=283909 RepID=R7V2E0_CAPTE|nr:hypothetical protein CAPTEDRAFT_200821 [Capitella teleta]|eukprot:ELU10506.1 hypothetical protein CAPTEDRAFT_200821 [Capitella teleta]
MGEGRQLGEKQSWEVGEEDRREKPNHENKTKSKGRKRSSPGTKQEQRRKKCLKTTSTIPPTPENLMEDNWGQRIPQIILLKVFSYAVAGGSLPFLCRACRVNTLWRETACHLSLWHKVDLSYGWIKTKTPTLHFLISHRLKLTRDLNLSMWTKLNFDGVKLVTDGCKHLQRLNLSYCKLLNSKTTLLLAEECPHLKAIDLTATSSDATAGNKVAYLIEKLGSNLESLALSKNTITGFNQILKALSTHSSNLRSFEACDVKFSSGHVALDIEQLQCGCPKLRSLFLTNSDFKASAEKTESEGFPELEDFGAGFLPTAHCSTRNSFLDANLVSRVLRSSFKLKSLDVRCNHSVSCMTLTHLVATDIERLYLGRSSAANSVDISLVIKKWRHSLVDLDVSWLVQPTDAVNSALGALSLGAPQILLLDCSGSSVSFAPVKKVLRAAPQLRMLDLTSCRDMPRGMKRRYEGADLEHLRREHR